MIEMEQTVATAVNKEEISIWKMLANCIPWSKASFQSNPEQFNQMGDPEIESNYDVY